MAKIVAGIRLRQAAPNAGAIGLGDLLDLRRQQATASAHPYEACNLSHVLIGKSTARAPGQAR